MRLAPRPRNAIRTIIIMTTLALVAIPSISHAQPRQPMLTYTIPIAAPSVDAPPARATGTFVSNGAEPHILVDKLGRTILIGDQLGVSVSTDGGRTFRQNTPLFIAGHDPITGSGIYDGWVLAQDDAGTVFASTTDGAIINVASSNDGGLTWSPLPSTLVVDAGFVADRPWLAARGNGEITVTWNEGGFWQRCASSTDGGLTWTHTVPALTTNGLPIGGRPAFDADGRLLYAGNGGVGGAAHTLFRYPTRAPCSGTLGELELPPVGDQLSTPLVTDASDRAYLATPSVSDTAMTLIGIDGFSSSGVKRIVVSSPVLFGNTFGTIAIRENGEVAVSWYATKTPGNFQTKGFAGEWNLYTARVTNFWSPSPTVILEQVTTTPNHIGDLCMQGTACDTGSGDRDLLDYFANTYDAQGNLHIAYGADGDTTRATVLYTRLAALT